MVRTAYKCRAYPAPEQASVLTRTFDCVRAGWNRSLAWRHQRYHAEQVKTNFTQANAYLTAMKTTEELAWLNEVPSVPLQQAIRHQQVAYTNGTAGPPFAGCAAERGAYQLTATLGRAFRRRVPPMTAAPVTTAVPRSPGKERSAQYGPVRRIELHGCDYARAPSTSCAQFAAMLTIRGAMPASPVESRLIACRNAVNTALRQADRDRGTSR